MVGVLGLVLLVVFIASLQVCDLVLEVCCCRGFRTCSVVLIIFVGL